MVQPVHHRGKLDSLAQAVYTSRQRHGMWKPGGKLGKLSGARTQSSSVLNKYASLTDIERDIQYTVINVLNI